LTNLQPHKSALPISSTVGIAASTLRPCFGQPVEVCIPCTFDTVTHGFLYARWIQPLTQKALELGVESQSWIKIPQFLHSFSL
jgi:hypothetical protein